MAFRPSAIGLDDSFLIPVGVPRASSPGGSMAARYACPARRADDSRGCQAGAQGPICTIHLIRSEVLDVSAEATKPVLHVSGKFLQMPGRWYGHAPWLLAQVRLLTGHPPIFNRGLPPIAEPRLRTD